ncbi:hypothetical protein HanIR_Chr09g0420701 [Helianthus annuus]|nr:hypothetical protein HanIR_Chr09g0420701 [Helianthus annuus]
MEFGFETGLVGAFGPLKTQEVGLWALGPNPLETLSIKGLNLTQIGMVMGQVWDGFR